MVSKLLESLGIKKCSCEIAGWGYADPNDDPDKFRTVNQTEFIREYLSVPGRQELFGHPPPFTDEEVALKVSKCFDSTGLTNRLFYSGTTEQLGFQATLACLKDAGVDPIELDAILYGSNTGKRYSSGADYIKLLLGARSNAWCSNTNEACTTGATAIHLGERLIRGGGYNYVLVVISEKATSLADVDDWPSSNLFGDSAFAVLLKISTQESYLFFDLISDPFDGKIELIGEDKLRHFFQKGKFVHGLIKKIVVPTVNETIIKSGIDIKKFKHVLMHQPSAKTIKLFEDEFRKLRPDFEGTIYKDADTGNTSSASTGILYSKLKKKNTFKKGDTILFVTFGAGFSIGIYAINY